MTPYAKEHNAQRAPWRVEVQVYEYSRTLPLVGASAVTALPHTVLALVGAPWRGLLLAPLPGAAVVLVASVFPQSSRDRLEWWRDWRRHREHLTQTCAVHLPPREPDDERAA